MISRQQIIEFIGSKQLAVISTVHRDGSPQSAVVGFGQTDDFQLIFGTSRLSRKAHNLEINKRVSFAIGWDDSRTVQYEGEARELQGEEADRFAELYYTKSPAARGHSEDPNMKYYLVEPRWIRHTDLSVRPWDVTELEF